MKLYNPSCLAGLASLALSATAAQAVVINFESFNVGDVISGPGVFADVEFSSEDRLLVVDSPTPGVEFSGTKAAAGLPFTGNPIEATFSIGNVNLVSVTLGDIGGDIDGLYLRAYDSTDGLLDEDTDSLQFPVTGITLSVNGGSGAISYVVFGGVSVFSNSVLFDDFTYATSSTEPPPPPPPTRVPDAGATSVLMMIGLGLLGAVRRFSR